MFGTSPVSQETANKLIPQLLRVNGNRFLSIEPQLSEIDLCRIDADQGGDKEWCMINCLTGQQTDMGRPCFDTPKIDWVIQGGESGHGKRLFNLDWAYDMKRMCKAANIPYFFKQIDKVQPIPNDLQIREFPNF
jgi:protein gp37